jgi:hypothetical protein
MGSQNVEADLTKPMVRVGGARRRIGLKEKGKLSGLFLLTKGISD